MILFRIVDRSSPIQTVFDGVTFKKEADDAAQEVCNLSILPPMSPVEPELVLELRLRKLFWITTSGVTNRSLPRFLGNDPENYVENFFLLVIHTHDCSLYKYVRYYICIYLVVPTKVGTQWY